MRTLLIASTNQGKIKEINTYFQKLNFNIKGLDDFPQIGDIEEDGNSFKENALKKARVSSKTTGLLTLADDSGLVVDYLDGAPGIYSARYAGEDVSDKENNNKLLKELKGVSKEERTAYFKCVMALVFPDKNKEYTFEGICSGLITKEPRGKHGFGYDPLFFVPEYEKTMAQLSPEIKNQISHRAKALKKVKNFFEDHNFDA